jgi:hypothetical protein
MSSGLLRALVPHLHRGGRHVSSAIYGTVSALAVIVVAAHEEAEVGRVLAFTAVSMVVVWGIHVYATVLSDACTQKTAWRVAIPRGFHEELGVLTGAAAPMTVLALGTLGVLDPDDAVWWSVVVGVALLTVMPVVWLRRSGQGWVQSVAAAAVACTFGLALVVMKVLAH